MLELSAIIYVNKLNLESREIGYKLYYQGNIGALNIPPMLCYVDGKEMVLYSLTRHMYFFLNTYSEQTVCTLACTTFG